MLGPQERDAVDAVQAIHAFWAALADDDDLALLRAIDQSGRDSSGTEPGICQRLRERLDVTSDECRTVGTTSKVRVVPGGPMVFVCMKLQSGKPKAVGVWGPEQMTGWWLTVALEGGCWRVSGRWDGEQWPEGTQYLDLPWAPPPELEH